MMYYTQSHGTTAQIPVIALSGANAQTADQLVKAVAEYGFVFVKGEGLGFTAQILNDTFALVSLEHTISIHSS